MPTLRKAAIYLVTIVASYSVGGEAQAQLTIPVLQPVIPFNYSRGRNVSVTERDRPEYQAIGVQAGGFTIYPRVDLGAGFTDNVYETNVDKRSSAFFSIVPTVKAVSGWSTNALSAEAGGDFRRFTSQSIRDQTGWHVNGDGRYDLDANSSIDLTGMTARQFETRFSGSTPTDTASATPYQITQGQLTALTSQGPIRLTGVLNVNHAVFSPITLLSGDRTDQSYRNRNVYSGYGQAEYAITPSTSLFAQVGYTATRYYTGSATGLNDRTSNQIRGLAGVSLDLSAVVRGSFGIGYSDRKYRSNLYEDVSGLALESRLELFPSELTTVTLAARRAIEDANTTGSPGYFNSGVGFQVDHELLRNLLINFGGDYENDNYRQIDSTAKIFAVNGGAHYLITRSFGISATASYGQRHVRGLQTGPSFSETSGLLSVFIQK